MKATRHNPKIHFTQIKLLWEVVREDCHVAYQAGETLRISHRDDEND